MKIIFLTLSLLLLSNLNFAQIAVDTLQLTYEHFKLKNGLEVILQPDDKFGEVSIEFWIRTGSKDELSEKYGLAHFFEHVTPYGLRNNEEKLKLLNEDFYNGSNAQTKKDYTRYNLKVKPMGIDLALQYTAERIKAKSYDIKEKKIEQERVRVFKEIKRNSVNPFWSADGGMALEKATYGKDHPYGHSGYGTIENNKKFEINDFRKWFSDYVYPENIILIVVGKFDPVKTEELIKFHFDDIPASAGKGNKEISFPKKINEYVKVKTKSDENYLNLVWVIPGWGSPEDAGFRLLSNILDERLENKIKNSPFIKDANSSKLLNIHKAAGQFGVYASFSSLKDSISTEEFLADTVDELVNNGVTDAELSRAKQKEIFKITTIERNIGFQNSRTELLGESLIFKNDPDFYFLRLNKQINLDVYDINELSKKWLSELNSKVLFIVK
ncbi:hypothetical protein LCGC14_1093910 [marine sediment metagenome]|uniref:Insulinase family protein n=2 Tax=root TaxID=1 RepID=A0A831QVG5_9FLAO|nr:insulinase family protein [Pricia antarctica]